LRGEESSSRGKGEEIETSPELLTSKSAWEKKPVTTEGEKVLLVPCTFGGGGGKERGDQQKPLSNAPRRGREICPYGPSGREGRKQQITTYFLTGREGGRRREGLMCRGKNRRCPLNVKGLDFKRGGRTI